MNPRFSIIPAAAVTDPRLEPRDLQTLCLLGRHIDNHGWCRRSQVRMARELACARSTVQASLDRLIAAGWVQKRPEPNGPQGQTSHSYRVRLDLDESDLNSLAAAHEERKQQSKKAPPTPADQSAPLPLQDRHPLPIYGSAPITTPVERVRERDSDSTVGTRTLSSESFPSSAREPEPAYRRKWAPLPTNEAAARKCFDRIGEAYALHAHGGRGAMGLTNEALQAIAELDEPDMDAAAEACGRWLQAMKAAKRSYSVTVRNYIVNREWKKHPPPDYPDDGKTRIPPRTHEWCAIFWRYALSDHQRDVDFAYAALRDASYDKPIFVKDGLRATQGELAAVNTKIEVDSEAFRQWDRAWAKHSKRVTGRMHWLRRGGKAHGVYIWVPSATPPIEMLVAEKADGAT